MQRDAGGREERFKKKRIKSALVIWTLEDGKDKVSDTASPHKA